MVKSSLISISACEGGLAGTASDYSTDSAPCTSLQSPRAVSSLCEPAPGTATVLLLPAEHQARAFPQGTSSTSVSEKWEIPETHQKAVCF